MNILWLDLETTGLNPSKDEILEVAAILTTGTRSPLPLTEIGRKNYVVAHEFKDFDKMDEWCRTTHLDSGLIKACTVGSPRYILRGVEDMLEQWLRDNVIVGDDKPILAGNSIHFDRAFLRYHMRDFEQLLHYRMLDVTSLKTVQQLAGHPVSKGKGVHRAMADIEESLAYVRDFTNFLRSEA